MNSTKAKYQELNAKDFQRFLSDTSYTGPSFEITTGEIYYDDPLNLMNENEYRMSVGFFLSEV